MPEHQFRHPEFPSKSWEFHNNSATHSGVAVLDIGDGRGDPQGESACTLEKTPPLSTAAIGSR